MRRFCQACCSWKIIACGLKVDPRIRAETLQWCEGCGQLAKAVLSRLQTDKWRKRVGYYSQKSCLIYVCAARFYHYFAALSRKASLLSNHLEQIGDHSASNTSTVMACSCKTLKTPLLVHLGCRSWNATYFLCY